MATILGVDALKKFLKYSDVETDNFVFRLHYKTTATIMLACSVLVSATQFFGDPIFCVTNDIVLPAIMNRYCWVEGTFTLRRSLNGTLGEDVAAPGVDQRRVRADDEVIEHTYYQWVSLFLFFQACAFYVPRWFWRIWEHGRMRGMRDALKKGSADKPEDRVKVIADYIEEHRLENQEYAYKFFFCEVMNLVNVLLQICLLDKFLNYQFSTYGPSALSFMLENPEDRVDPMSKVFPKMSKCRLRRFGTSGEVQIHDAICLLSLNIVNEKIFVIIWFWLVFLAVVTLSNVIYRSTMIGVPRYRYRLLNSMARMVEAKDLKKVTERGRYGDWFMLSLLKDNVEPQDLKRVVKNLSTRLEPTMEKEISDSSENV